MVASPPGLATTETLPRGIVADSVRRFGWVALALAVMAASVWLTGAWIQPGWIDPAKAPSAYTWAIAATLVLGLTGFGLSLASGRALLPATVLDAAFVLQPLLGLTISLAENAVPRLNGEVVRGSSSVVVWIAIFCLAVPASFGRAVVASMATAVLAPLGLMIHIVAGNVPNPPPVLWTILFGGNFLMALAAPLLARMIYHLAAQVKSAHELGGYRLIERIGRGGMGEVWRAEHRIVGRLAAVKLIRPESLAGPGQTTTALKRFRLEAEATARLHSPHTVALYDYGVSDAGQFYYVMELLSGIDLETLVSRFGSLPASRAIHVLRQACDSLQEAHAQGLTHRDIKPRNILLCRLGTNYDFVKVLDFGLVKAANAPSMDLTMGAIAGTPAFMAPEMARGNRVVDGRTDIYALGCVGYWLLTGRLVFEAGSALEMAMAHVKESPMAPSEQTENEIPVKLESILMACLEKDPTRRPQSMAELARALDACGQSGAWTRESAEEWWRLHRPIGSESELLRAGA